MNLITKNKLPKRPINGILLLDKAIGISSNHALQAAKRLYQAQKAGHAGTLDPLASGMLPIALGEATKFSQFLLDARKNYLVTATLGIQTTTGDAEGMVTQKTTPRLFTPEELEAVLAPLRGTIQQIPSMYSALKHHGQPLYQLARQGLTIEREPRTVTIDELTLLDYQSPQLTLKIHCSKGTYVRCLIEDIGKALGCGAHISALRRTYSEPYKHHTMYTFSALEKCFAETGLPGLDALLLPIDSGLNHFPVLSVSAAAAYYLLNGQGILSPIAPREGFVRLHREDNAFIGLAETNSQGWVMPRRMLQST